MTREKSRPPRETGEERLTGEDLLIARIAEKFGHGHPGLIKGIGDDTSVTAQTPGTVLLATTDTLVESTHFTLDTTTPAQLGAKALGVSISDIAAMGGRPTFFLISLVLPKTLDTGFVEELYAGLSATALVFGATMAGGNMSAGKDLTVTVTLLGEAKPEKVVYRSGAEEGQGLYVTGTPGDSALGLRILSETKKGGTGESRLKEFKQAVKRHLTPTPRLEAGTRLAERGIAASMIDVSDGIVLDARRLAKESGVGIDIEISLLPLSPEIKRYMETGGSGKEAGLLMALAGGEDYELLFSADLKDETLIEKISEKLKLGITKIGSVTSKNSGVRVIGADGVEMALERGGYEHF